MPDSGNGNSRAPKVAILEACDFTTVGVEIPGYGGALQMPCKLLNEYDGGAHATRINTPLILPDFGGKTSGRRTRRGGILPHHDHKNRKHRMRFVILTWMGPGPRGSWSILTLPEVTASLLPVSMKYFRENRRILSDERDYDPRFEEAYGLSNDLYEACFESDEGVERAAAVLAGPGASHVQTNAAHTNLLALLVRGPHAQEAVILLLRKADGACYVEKWLGPGSLVFDNWNTDHWRFGGNLNPSQRNYAVYA